ncbi:uncharacterized protein CTRU02_209545 [Colletotrichum truncatum]|uniref:Uncharacterized protein n=1 Tax=Colletotrichum truncatum TaxID=5467 RepID=A0ACC3YSP4_COLTU|nr:uncharacterized protein CTRU02_14471 [Colletotrichum truncatum]KAF6782141.1 hypothetical protein CTRU02_14471 [Colletotrichum truncatum]
MLVLIYGITGMVGQPTARAALAAGHQVRGLGRNPQKLQSDLADSLESFVVIKDAYDIQALDQAVKGVDAIVSAPSGAFETALDGQILLLRAAERAGVKVFHAASWNYDWTRLPLGFHEGYDPLISFWNHARLSSNIKPIYTFTGTIPDYVMYSSVLNNPIDSKLKTFSYFGTGDEVDIYTTVDDLASYTIAAISEPNAEDGGVRYVESFRASMHELADAYEKVHGVELERKNLGTVEDVERLLQEGRDNIHPSNYNDYSAFIYLKIQLRGLCLHDSKDSRRWSQIKPISLEDWLKAHQNI